VSQLVGPRPLNPGDEVDKQYVDDAVAARTERVIVDFGPGDNGAGDTTALGTGLATWVTADTTIVCVPDPAGTADHSAEDAAVERVTATVTYLEPGVGFDLIAVSPTETFGQYAFLCTRT
jgi:NAD(P)H-hydrate repair Nnr-like enzyme with NAD(P)H-hydrate epimerase domain